MMMNIYLMKNYLRNFFLFLFTTGSVGLFAQMEVSDAATPPFTPENLISNIFLGDGVSILDITYEGDPLAVGYFKNGENAIGLERGIILTSGRAAAQSCNGGPFGADCNGNTFASNDMNSFAADPDLNAIANGTPQDVAKYTITFQPFADTLRFRYVFASEEYPEYSCSSYNDVFGFFISGPGITGPYSNNGKNIALIPGTNTPVAIDKIHPPDPTTPGCVGVNNQYYNNNNGFALQPVYDGYLDIFIAEAVVIPCETYTIKIMISDVSDNWFDSGVFLEAKSFGTGSINVEAATISLDGTITEGCSNGSFTFSLPQEAEADLYLDYTIIGDAINGTDYEVIPDNLFIPQGQTSITVPINAIVDDLDEGLESIGIDIQRDVCNRDTFWIFIRDNEIVPPNLGNDLMICQGDSVQLDGTLPLPLPVPPSFTNDNTFFIDETAPVYSPIQVVGVQPVTLGPGVIQTVCVNIDHNWVDDLDLYLISPSGQFIELSSMNGANCDNYTNVCFSPNATIPINYTFPWPPCSSGVEPGFANGTYLPEGVWEDLWDGSYFTNGIWQLLVLDESNGFDGEILDWTITFEPLYQLNYSWEPSEGLSCTDCPNPKASPEESTTYYLTVSDTYGCEVYDTITVKVEKEIPAPLVNCVSVSNNSIDFEWENVNGAMGYMVSVNGAAFTVPNNGPLGHTVTGLNLDETVTISVYGIGPCDGLIGTATCTTPSCDAPTIIIDEIRHIECFGDNNGFVSVTATGGAGDYTFGLDSTTTNVQGNFPGLNGGPHTFTVTDSWGCPNAITLNINEPAELIGVHKILNNVTCFGGSNGSATVDITGGIAPYMVNWSNGQEQDTVTNLPTGSHFVFITDANGCTHNFNFQITQPPQIILTTSAQGVGCNGANTGSVTVQVQGGVMPYFIQWDANAGNATTNTVNNLPAGSYTVAVTDSKGCVKLAEVQVDEPNGMDVTISKTDISCFGNADGTAMASVSGGSTPYTYLWNNGSTTADLTDLSTGIYEVTITDNGNCTTVASIEIETPTLLELSLAANEPLCFNDPSGATQSSVSGGTLPYTYAWDTGQNTSSLQGVAAGNYCLTVTDGNSCIVESCVEVTDPPALGATTTTTNAACNSPEGSINLSVLGGQPPYQFLWSSGDDTEDVSGLLPGPYEVTITDANNCTIVTSATINETEAISIDFTTNEILCNGENTGAINITVAGGSGDYTFAWTGPNGFATDSKDIQNVVGGNYTLSIEDTDGCSFSTQITIDQPATPLEIFHTITNVACPGEQNGAIRLEATGGTPPYTYQLNSNGFIGNPNFFSLQSGFYNIRVKDKNGCLLDFPDLLVDEPQPFSVDLGDDIVASFGEQVSITPTLANVPDSLLNDYFYEWTSSNPQMPPANPAARAADFEAIGPTTIKLTVTSPNGCEEEDILNLFVVTNRSVLVPTGFTPDNLGPSENNLLHVHGNSKMVERIRSFQVFDRWGELLYEANDFSINDMSTGWDGTFKGKEMPAGVYVWYLEVDYIDGINESLKGHTTLIR